MASYLEYSRAIPKWVLKNTTIVKDGKSYNEPRRVLVRRLGPMDQISEGERAGIVLIKVEHVKATVPTLAEQIKSCTSVENATKRIREIVTRVFHESDDSVEMHLFSQFSPPRGKTA